MKLKLLLNLPLSINQLYINQTRYDKKTKKYISTGKRILSQKGKMNKKMIQKYAKKQIKGQKDWSYEKTKECYIYMDVVIFFPRKGMDADNIFKILNDSLEKIVFDNDSRVLPRVNKVLYDSEEPRIEVEFKEVEYIGIFDNNKELEIFESNCESCSRYLNGRCSILNQAKEGRIQEEIDENNDCMSYTERKS